MLTVTQPRRGSSGRRSPHPNPMNSYMQDGHFIHEKVKNKRRRRKAEEVCRDRRGEVGSGERHLCGLSPVPTAHRGAAGSWRMEQRPRGPAWGRSTSPQRQPGVLASSLGITHAWVQIPALQSPELCDFGQEASPLCT